MSSSPVKVKQMIVGPYKNFCYIAYNEQQKEAVVFDPAWEVSKILSFASRLSLKIDYIVNTHAHADHIEGNASLKQATGAKIIMSERSSAKKDIAVKDDMKISAGRSIKLQFLLTPGHSPESMCIIVNDFALITGDTLFIGECGRTDLSGGSAVDLYHSFNRIRKLDPNLIIYPGHDYGRKPSTTLKEQLIENYTLADRSLKEFVQFMSEP